MRTIEFKLYLNHSQQIKVDKWLDVQHWVWNCGLELLEKFHAFRAWDRSMQAWVDCCPLPWKYYQSKDNNQLVPFCRLPWTYYQQGKDLIPFCRLAEERYHLPQDCQKPQIQFPTYFGLIYYFTQKNHTDKPWFCEVPSKFVSGTLKALTDAWSEYKSGKRRRPHYKRYRDKSKTLINNNAKSIKISGKQITIPKLGKVSVKTLSKRWDATVPISTLKIIKSASGYYLQLTGNLPKVKKPLPSDKAVGLVTGIKTIYTTDSEKVIESPQYYQKMEKRLKRLGREASRRQSESANQKKTYQRLARLHERIRRSRRAFNHKLSTYLVREYGAIAVNETKSTKRVNANTEINKALTDNAVGQLLTFLKHKAQIAEREFIVVPNQALPIEQKTAARSVYTTAKPSFIRNYRPWGWEVTPGESTVTLNQEVLSGTPLRDAETTSNFSKHRLTESCKRVDVSSMQSTNSNSQKGSQQTNRAPTQKAIEIGTKTRVNKRLQKLALDETELSSDMGLQEKEAIS